eukprot:CAMPEP_0116020894 /NCGR_PEP_ID=MMETSP0321-20121206/10067_1 /TAXON_ID=163516 /ORGANISM="Leptocylindrus danicus var. danicus, Strain B650" /LENGTH=388 /DNA_ID=CAMNT_0003491669 /DNA_START=272 /DNA_END=1438 /DNA_ORIENTATION=+
MGFFGKSAGKNDGKPGFITTPGAKILVTGSSGLVGARLVEMLLERGASLVRAFDIVAPSAKLSQRFDAACEGQRGKYECIVGNLTDKQACLDACKDIDVIYHIAALVGPFHDRDKYMAVNYDGTMNVLEGAIQETMSSANRTVRFIYSSSPSTRFTGGDVTGQREEELPIPDKFLALYAESKAYAEKKVSEAYKLHKGLLTISVAPHQVYGPYDALFLPSLLETAGNNNLRIFGSGKNLISVCYVDNYCHGLMCGADALEEGSTALGKFYIVTDGPEQNFWGILNTAIVAMGFADLFKKFHLPVWLLMGLAHICDVIGWILNKKLKLNPFNVKMLVIHRYFSIENARRDLKYEPLFTFDDAWGSTIEWFKINWLPGFLEQKNGSSKTK